MGYVVSANWGETDLLSTARVTIHEGVQRLIEISTKYGGGHARRVRYGCERPPAAFIPAEK